MNRPWAWTFLAVVVGCGGSKDAGTTGSASAAPIGSSRASASAKADSNELPTKGGCMNLNHGKADTCDEPHGQDDSTAEALEKTCSSSDQSKWYPGACPKDGRVAGCRTPNAYKGYDVKWYYATRMFKQKGDIEAICRGAGQKVID